MIILLILTNTYINKYLESQFALVCGVFFLFFFQLDSSWRSRSRLMIVEVDLLFALGVDFDCRDIEDKLGGVHLNSVRRLVVENQPQRSRPRDTGKK